MEMSQSVYSFQPGTSYLSCSISASLSCFKFSVILLELRKLLKSHSLLSQLFWDTWDAQDTVCSCYRSQHPAYSKSREKKHFTGFYALFLSHLKHSSIPKFWIYLHVIIFLEQMIDSQSKKMDLSSICHEVYYCLQDACPSLSFWKILACHSCGCGMMGLMYCFGVGATVTLCMGICVRSSLPYNPQVVLKEGWSPASAAYPMPTSSFLAFCLEAATATLCFTSVSSFERFPKQPAAFPTCSDLESPCMTAFWNGHKYVFSLPIHVLNSHLND